MRIDFSFFKCLPFNLLNWLLLLFLSAFSSSVFSVFMNWKETGKVTLLEVEKVTDVAESEGVRRIEFGPYISFNPSDPGSQRKRIFENMQDFMTSEEGVVSYKFMPLFDNDVDLYPCCPAMDDGCSSYVGTDKSKGSNTKEFNTEEKSNDDRESQNEDKLLPMRNVESVAVLMGEDCNIYIVLYGQDHPYNAYEFEEFFSQDDACFSIGQEALCNKFVWYHDVVDVVDVVDGANTISGQDRYKEYLANRYYEKGKNTPKKFYSFFVFKLDLVDQAYEKLNEYLLGDQRNEFANKVLMGLTITPTERKKKYEKLGQNNAGWSSKKTIYSWAYSFHAHYDTRARDVSLLIFNLDLFCSQSIQIPAILKLSRSRGAKEKVPYPVHFYIYKNKYQDLFVEVFIEDFNPRNNFSDHEGVQACLTTKIIKKNAVNPELNDVVESREDFQENTITGEGSLRYAFMVDSEIVKRVDKDSCLGFNFDFLEAFDSFWEYEFPHEALLKITGSIKPGNRKTDIIWPWKSVNETYSVFLDDGSGGESCNTVKTPFHGQLKVSLHESEFKQKHHLLVQVAVKPTNHSAGNSLKQALVKADYGDDKKEKGFSSVFASAKDKTRSNLGLAVKQAEWCTQTAKNVLTKETEKKAPSVTATISVLALVMEAKKTKTIAKPGQPKKTREVTSTKLMVYKPSGGEENCIQQHFTDSGTIKIRRYEYTVFATFWDIDKNVFKVSFHNNNGSMSYADCTSNNNGRITLTAHYLDEHPCYIAAFHKQTESINAEEKMVVKGLNRMLDLSGISISDSEKNQQFEEFLSSKKALPSTIKVTKPITGTNTDQEKKGWLSGSFGNWFGGGKSRAIEESKDVSSKD